jgi:fucose permease
MNAQTVVVIEPRTRMSLMFVACAGLFLYGMLVAFLGAVMPSLCARLSLGTDRSGLLFSVLYFPQILAVFAAGPVIDRYGAKPAFCTGAILCGAGFAGAGLAGSYPLLVMATLVLGVGGGLVSNASNTLVTDLNPENPASSLNVGHAFFGLGAAFFPAAVAVSERQMGLIPAIGVTLLLTGGIALFALSRDFPIRQAAGQLNWRVVRGVISHPAVPILSAVVLITTGLAVSIGGWLRFYLEQEFSASGRASGLVLTLFWSLTVIARLISGRVLKVLRGPRFVLWCSISVLLGLMLLTMAPYWKMAVAGVIACGLSYGPIYPTTVGSAGAHFPKFFATVFGCMQGAGLLGGMVLPPLVGWVASTSSIRLGLWSLVAGAILLVAFQATFVGYEPRMRRPEEPQSHL